MVAWTKEQESFVLQNYNGNGSDLSNVLPFTGSAVRNKAKRLGVKKINRTKIQKLSEFDIGYIAAFLDGEGSIYKSGTSQYKIQFANSDEMVIRWIHSILAIGKVRRYKPRANQHMASFVLCIERQGDVWGFLEIITPYLKVKQLKATESLVFLRTKYL